MDCGFWVHARYEAYSMSVCSEAGMGDPFGWSWLYVRVNVIKLCVAVLYVLYVLRVDVAREWCR